MIVLLIKENGGEGGVKARLVGVILPSVVGANLYLSSLRALFQLKILTDCNIAVLSYVNTSQLLTLPETPLSTYSGHILLLLSSCGT